MWLEKNPYCPLKSRDGGGLQRKAGRTERARPGHITNNTKINYHDETI